MPWLATSRSLLLDRRILRDADIAKTQISRLVVPLNADVPRFGPVAVARVGIGFAVVIPINRLHTVHPCGEMVAVSRDGQREPLAVFGHALSSRDTPVNGTGTVIESAWPKTASGSR